MGQSDYGSEGASIWDRIQINASEGASEYLDQINKVKGSQSGTIQINGSEGAPLRDIIQIKGNEGA